MRIFAFFLSGRLEVSLLGLTLLLRDCQTAFHVTFLPAVTRSSDYSASLLALGINIFINLLLVDVRWYLLVLLICISLMTNYVEHFSWAYWPFGLGA